MDPPAIAHRAASLVLPFLRRHKFLTVSAVVAVVIVIATTCAGQIAASRLEQRLRHYTDQGYPVKLSDLPGFFPNLPPEVNAATYFSEALLARGAYLSSPRFRKDRVGLPFLDPNLLGPRHVDEASASKAKDYLEANADWVDTVRRISAYPGCASLAYRRCRAFAQIRHPFLQPLSHGVNTLCLASMVSLTQGDMDTSVQLMHTAKAFDEKLLSEPFLVGVASALCGEKLILKSAEVILESGPLSPENVRQMRHVCTPISTEWIRMALLADRLAGLDYYYHKDAGPELDEHYSFSYLGRLPLVVSCRKVNEYLDFMDSCIQAAEQPGTIRMEHALRIERRRTQRRISSNPLLALAPPFAAIANAYVRYAQLAGQLERKLDEAEAASPPAQSPTHDGGGKRHGQQPVGL